MKRFIITLLIVVFGFASKANAQDCKVDFQKFFGQASEALEFVATHCDYELIGDKISTSVSRNAREYQSVSEAVADITKDVVGYNVVTDSSRRIIKVTRTASVDASRKSTTTANDCQSQARAKYPNAYHSDGTIGSFSDRGALMRELSTCSQIRNPSPAPTAADRQFVPPTQYIPPTPQSFFAPNPYGYSRPTYNSYGYGEYSNYGGLLTHGLIQRQIDLDTWGALKFKKGREQVMENMEVWGCGEMLAQADEGNNFWDHKVLVPVNCRPLTFRYTDGAKIDWEAEIPYMIVPLRLQSAKNVTLDKAFFDRARKRTEYLKYSLVQQANGDFKRVARPEPATQEGNASKK